MKMAITSLQKKLQIKTNLNNTTDKYFLKYDAISNIIILWAV